MSAASGQAPILLRPSKVKGLAIALLAPLFVIFTLSMSASAEDPPILDNPSEGEKTSSVESPAVPAATSSTENYNITWVWGPPAGGLKPDATEENPDVENPTDIVSYGYELLLGSTVIETSVVDTSVLSVTTPVQIDGTYVLRVWSVTRTAETSSAAEGSIVIAKPLPPLPPIEPEIIPAPIDAKPIANDPVESSGPVKYTITPASPNFTRTLPLNTAEVLSASAKDESVIEQVAKSGVVKPSSQGWVILGVAWYIWLIIIGGLYFPARWLHSVVSHR